MFIFNDFPSCERGNCAKLPCCRALQKQDTFAGVLQGDSHDGILSILIGPFGLKMPFDRILRMTLEGIDRNVGQT